MSFLKKHVFAPFVFTAAVLSAQSVIADPVSHTILLETTVPEADFYVLPTDSTWIGNTQVLPYNMATGTINSLSKSFDYKHSAGAISGTLLSTPVITSDSDSIKLDVTFNAVKLSTTGEQVITAVAAATGGSTSLVIEPIKPATGYKPGKYTGNVQVSFDAVVTP